MRFAVESAPIPAGCRVTARERASKSFSLLRVRDTEATAASLIYGQLVDHDLESCGPRYVARIAQDEGNPLPPD